MGSTLQIETGNLFQCIYDCDKRFIVNVGGTRSGKTYTTLQTLIVKALASQETKVVSIVRKSLPSLKITALRDFITILKQLDLYSESNHSMVENIYQLNNWTFEFFSVDDPQKKRGSKRDILFLNEANELGYEDFFQLQIRTTEQIIIDYNPSTLFWCNDKLIGQPDVEVIHSTYKDNPFLPKSMVDEIEKLKDIDPQYWRVYGLGEYAGDIDVIFHYTTIDTISEEDIERGIIKLVGLGLDFGYSNDPTALVEVYKQGDNLYINELLYDTGLTNQDIVEKLKAFNVDRSVEIIADSAEPKSIEEIYRSKFNIKPAKKGPDSIQNGIDILKRHKLHVTANSRNVIRELNNYKWSVDKNNIKLNKPIDAFNHSVDALRYLALNKLATTFKSGYNIRIVGNTVY